MKLSLKKSTIQAGVTPIENMFLDIYLPISDEISLKVYLFLYKRIYGSYKQEVTLDLISKELKFSSVQITNALKYWKNNGLIDFTLNSDGEIEEIEFYNLFALYAGNVYTNEQEEIKVEKPLIQDLEYSKKIESIIGLTLKPHEISSIIDHIEETGHGWNMVYRAYKFADENKKSKSVNYIIGILRSWIRDNGIKTEADLDYYFANKDKTKKIKSSKRINKYIEKKDILTKEEKQDKLKNDVFDVNDMLERY